MADQHLSVLLSNEQHARLRRVAKKTRTSMTQIARAAIVARITVADEAERRAGEGQERSHAEPREKPEKPEKPVGLGISFASRRRREGAEDAPEQPPRGASPGELADALARYVLDVPSSEERRRRHDVAAEALAALCGVPREAARAVDRLEKLVGESRRTHKKPGQGEADREPDETADDTGKKLPAQPSFFPDFRSLLP